MTKIVTFIGILALTTLVQAGLKPGDKLQAYTIQNVETGKKYCQVCAYGGKQAKLIAFGKLDDKKFWMDLKKIQALHEGYENLGVFAHVIDTKDRDAVRAKAKEYGITFPVVIDDEKDWNKKYAVNGVSRTIYYAKKSTITWTHIGLENDADKHLATKVKEDLS